MKWLDIFPLWHFIMSFTCIHLAAILISNIIWEICFKFMCISFRRAFDWVRSVSVSVDLDNTEISSEAVCIIGAKSLLTMQQWFVILLALWWEKVSWPAFSTWSFFHPLVVCKILNLNSVVWWLIIPGSAVLLLHWEGTGDHGDCVSLMTYLNGHRLCSP